MAELRSLPYAVSSRAAVAARRFPWLEGALIVVVSFLAELYQDKKIIFGQFVFESDARLHEFWMRRFQDPDLFHDPLTEALLNTAYIPYGFRGLHWLASWAIDPIRFAEAVPLVLAPLSAWLLFRIVREHTDWWPAAWLGSLLFVFAWDMHRFTGGHQRAYGPVIVVLTLYLLLRRRDVAAAAVPIVGALFYPSAAAVAVLTIAFSSLELLPGRRLDVRRAVVAVGAGVGALLALVLPQVIVRGGFPEIVTRDAARSLPDFGEDTDVRYFTGSILDYLSQKASGFGLAWTGSMLVVGAIVILALRPRNALLLRREVWAMLASSLLLFGLAQAFLFRFYLPHRYAYAIVPFCAILIAVGWQPTWQAAAERVRRPWLLGILGVAVTLAVAWVALVLFPFGLRLPWDDSLTELFDDTWYYLAALAVGLLLAWLLYRPGAAWVAASACSAALLVTLVGVAGADQRHGITCGRADLLRYLGNKTEKDAIIAGNPVLMDCVGVVSRRPVVMSEKLWQVWEVDFWREGRRRMFDSVDAYYGDSMDDVLALRDRYGADYLVVEKRYWLDAWKNVEPFTSRVHQLVNTVETPAVRRLPEECVVFTSRLDRVYDLDCVADRVSPPG